MKLFNLAKCALITLCISGLVSNPALAHKKHHDNWDKHYYGNNKHGYQINHNSYASGRVLEVIPIYKDKRNNQRHQHCWLEPERRYHQQHYEYRKENKTVDTLAGAVIGGVIGNQFGSGNGNKVATVAGAVLGGSLANEYASDYRHGKHHRNTRYNNRLIEVCDNGVRHGKHFKHNSHKIKGYHVTYKYKGEVYQSFTRERPGKYIDLVVSVIPRE